MIQKFTMEMVVGIKYLVAGIFILFLPYTRYLIPATFTPTFNFFIRACPPPDSYRDRVGLSVPSPRQVDCEKIFCSALGFPLLSLTRASIHLAGNTRNTQHDKTRNR